jgi:hypothetical protein
MTKPAYDQQTLRQEFRQLQMCGATRRQVADRYGYSTAWVDRWRERFDLRPFEYEDRSGRCVQGNGWTEQEDALLRSAVKDGCTAVEAAARIGRSVEAVRNRRLKLSAGYFARKPRLAPPRWPKERIDQLAGLLASGATYSEAAAELQCTHNAVAGAKHRFLSARSTQP